jgi:hypothetical protein
MVHSNFGPQKKPPVSTMPTKAVFECCACLPAYSSFHPPLNTSNQSENNLHYWEYQGKGLCLNLFTHIIIRTSSWAEYKTFSFTDFLFGHIFQAKKAKQPSMVWPEGNDFNIYRAPNIPIHKTTIYR